MVKLKGAGEAYKGVLEANGISEKTATDDAESIKHIEMFLFNFSKMQSLETFVGLTSLVICQQAITEIECLDTLVNLQDLWLCETNATKIKGLQNNTKLRRLYLYSNRIRTIENLSHLTDLQTLWLFDNEIPEIKNLEALTGLTELNLARNKIREIASSLDANVSLLELNLAGNELWSFKDLLNLTRAASLRKLSFSDPDYGDNPVCELCNYQTYVFFHLQQLSHMDTMAIPDEGKHLAEATYMKKKMYYNMRIKTLKRNTTNILRKGKDAFLQRKNQLTLTLNVLVRQMKDIERALEEGPGEEGEGEEYPSEEARVEALQSKHKALKQAINAKAVEIRSAEDQLSAMKAQVCSISDYNTSRLIVELETGGNIRLEDGKPSDVWYSSCVDLVNSRFFQGDFQPYGIADLRVTRVTRIHNRFLRNRFEERLETLVDTSDPSYKRSLEYLFYGQDPRLPGEILRVAEEGFRSSDEYGRLGLDEAVALSNSLSTADVPRVQDAVRRMNWPVNKDGTPKSRVGLDVGGGQLLITKVFLARCTAERSAGGEAEGEGGAGGEREGGGEAAVIQRSSYAKHDSVYRLKQSDSKQRTWFVFDHCLVLPEYLVEFEYVMKSKSSPDPPLAFMAELVEKGVLQPQNETEANDMGPLARVLVKFLYHSNLKASPASTHDEASTKILNSPPVIPSQPPVSALTLDVLLVKAKTADLAKVRYLNLHSNQIRKMENLQGLVSLETLILSFNEIGKMEGLDAVTTLRKLDLSFNLIRRLENLKSLAALAELELNSNLVHRAEDLSMLRKYVPNLVSLNFANNPVCEMKSYRHYVLRRLLKLECLDGQPVTPAEQQLAMANTSSIKTQMVKDNAFVQRRSNWSLMPARFRRQGLFDKEALAEAGDDELWWERVQDLELNHRHLRKISNLERLVNLRVLSVCDNEILAIQGLERCVLLEELLMEENRISKIENLSTLINLKKLDLGKNKISKVESLDGLTNLAQLSLEDNEVEGLGGLSRLSTLLELYLGNNKCGELREVLQLKPLPKLIILDLSGNPVCYKNEYRLYSIFHLRRLKVLDGLGVEGGEQQAANETYSGRLTEEFVVEKLGHRFFEHVSELDLSGNKIRDTSSCICGERFPNLRVLNLDNNIIADTSGLADLAALAVLRLNHNRIESLVPDRPRGQPDAAPVGLQTLSALEVLQLGFNDIHSLAPLRTLPVGNLKVLFLQANDISKLEGLENLTQVRELVLDKNKIRHVDFGSLLALVNLRELRLEENGLKSLSNLVPLPRLQALHLGANRVGDMAEMDKLAPLPCILDLTLSNNPLARKQLYRATAIQKLPTLRILDNKEITIEERERVDVLFAMDSRSSQNYMPGPAAMQQLAAGIQSSAAKVPIKMSSVTFDQLGGAVQAPAGGGSGASFMCIGLSKGGDAQRPEADWHPFHNSAGDFFLPAGKMSGRPRANSGSTGSLNDDAAAQQHNAAEPAGWADRRQSPHSKLPTSKQPPGSQRPRSGDKPRGAGGQPASAAAVASAALEARSMATGMPGQSSRSRKLGYLLGSVPAGSTTTPRGRHASPGMNGGR